MGKKAASWTIDEDILAWIGSKLGSKSRFVNDILLRAKIREEEVRTIKKVACPKCWAAIPEDTDCHYCLMDEGVI